MRKFNVGDIAYITGLDEENIAFNSVKVTILSFNKMIGSDASDEYVYIVERSDDKNLHAYRRQFGISGKYLTDKPPVRIGIGSVFRIGTIYQMLVQVGPSQVTAIDMVTYNRFNEPYTVGNIFDISKKELDKIFYGFTGYTHYPNAKVSIGE